MLKDEYEFLDYIQNADTENIEGTKLLEKDYKMLEYMNRTKLARAGLKNTTIKLSKLYSVLQFARNLNDCGYFELNSLVSYIEILIKETAFSKQEWQEEIEAIKELVWNE